MNPELTSEAVEYGGFAARAFEAAGGEEFLARAEADPAGRAAVLEPVLAELGALDLEPRTGPDDLEAAATLCRAAGAAALPYPLAERLARPTDLDVDGLVVVVDRRPSAPLEGITGRYGAVTLDGRRALATPRPPTEPTRKSAFVVDLDLEPLDADGAGDVALALVLPCWTLLGMMDRAIALTCDYARDRQQFGQPLSGFQGVQFQLTNAELERSGVEELAKYALWTTLARPDDALADALALRLAAIEAAEIVFRITHQLHGAIGFCDETALSWLSRASQPLRRLPLGASATRDALLGAVGRRGLTGIFDEPDVWSGKG